MNELWLLIDLMCTAEVSYLLLSFHRLYHMQSHFANHLITVK